MTPTEHLRSEWNRRNRLQPMHHVMTITDGGLVLGAGTVLMPPHHSEKPTGGLVLGDSAEERLLVLLTAAYAGPIERRVLGNIRRA